MKFRSFICSKEDGVEMVRMTLKNLANEKVNVAPLVFQGFSFNGNEYNVNLVFDGMRNDYKEYNDIPRFWKPYVESVLNPGSIEVSLKALVLNIFKGVGYEDAKHVYLPTDDENLEYMARYIIRLIDEEVNMVR